MTVKAVKIFLLAFFFSAVVFSAGTAFAQSEDELFIIYAAGDETAVYVLMREESAGGERFVALVDPGDPEIEYFSKGDEAMLTFDGDKVPQFVLLQNGANREELFLTVDGKVYRMREVEAASGVKYEAAGDKNTFLWGKGKSVTLTVNGKEYPGYDTWQPAGRIWRPGE